jgi:acetyl esterase/lipase
LDNKFFAVGLAVLAVLARPSSAQTTYRLWEGQAPGATGTGSADIPTLAIYKPSAGAANGAAFLMVPGGGYGTVVMSEADAARAFWIPKGFVVAVLKYRVAPYRYPVPMHDVKRAMRLLRSMTGELGVDSNRVGILGCSAGGHLASYLATHHDRGDASATDPVERHKSRPDFSVFVYPVITMDASFTHAGSRSALLGNNPAAALVDSLSNEKQVKADTPPSFLVHGTVDNVVQWKNSQVFYDSCVAKKVPAKFHRITGNCGGHGFGYNCDNWGEAGYGWLKSGGYLDATGPVALSGRKAEDRLARRHEHPGSYLLINAAGRVVQAGNAVPSREWIGSPIPLSGARGGYIVLSN